MEKLQTARSAMVWNVVGVLLSIVGVGGFMLAAITWNNPLFIVGCLWNTSFILWFAKRVHRSWLWEKDFQYTLSLIKRFSPDNDRVTMLIRQAHSRMEAGQNNEVSIKRLQRELLEESEAQDGD